MNVSIDTGANCSIISRAVIEMHPNKFKLRKASLRMKTADGSTKPVKNVVKNVTTEIQDNISKLDFLVLNNTDYDVLLGLDWFNLTKAGIFPATLGLVLPENNQKPYQLQSNEHVHIKILPTPYTLEKVNTSYINSKRPKKKRKIKYNVTNFHNYKDKFIL